MANDTIQIDESRAIPTVVATIGYRLAEFRWILLGGLLLLILIVFGGLGLLAAAGVVAAAMGGLASSTDRRVKEEFVIPHLANGQQDEKDVGAQEDG